MPEVSQKRMEKGLEYLATTDAQHGMLKALVDDLEYRIKVAEAQGIKEGKDKGTQDYIKSLARTSEEYKRLVDELYNMNLELQIMSAKRNTEQLIFEAWRSVNSNRRAGVVT